MIERSTTSPELDLRHRRRIHLVGVGGAGISAIAEVLAGMGHVVSGTDAVASPVLGRLKGLGVSVEVGHRPSGVEEAEIVAVSTAVPSSDPEVVAARRAGIPVLSRAALLSAVTRTRRTVAVTGTHGKTTTSAMLALSLAEAGLRPSFILGGRIDGLGTGARWDTGEWLVVEADESDGTFLQLDSETAVVTSVEPDHLETYGGFEGLVSAFDRFLDRLGDRAVVCADDPVANRLRERHGASSYGTVASAGYRMLDLELGPSGSAFTLAWDGEDLGPVRIPMPGRHNALNAAGAVAGALRVGAPFEPVARALARFPGVARRFELRGQAAGVTYVDDYAHLPTEVSAALSAAAGGRWRRVVCVFQPHRYSRTSALWADFAHAFEGADVVVVTDVYAAGEPIRPGVSGRLIADAVRTADPSRPVTYLPGRAELVAYLRAHLEPGDLCLTLGAGDLTSVPDELLGPGARAAPSERGTGARAAPSERGTGARAAPSERGTGARAAPSERRTGGP